MVRKHERYGKLTNMLSNTGNTNVMKNIVLDDERSDVDLRFSIRLSLYSTWEKMKLKYGINVHRTKMWEQPCKIMLLRNLLSVCLLAVIPVWGTKQIFRYVRNCFLFSMICSIINYTNIYTSKVRENYSREYTYSYIDARVHNIKRVVVLL